MAEALEEKIRKYTQQLAQDPKSRAFVPLSDAYRALGRCDEAVAVAKEGLAHHPHYLAGKVALARALFENGDADDAASILEGVVRTAPDNLLANRILSEILVQNGEAGRAMPILKRLLALEPNDLRAAEQLAALSASKAEPAVPSASVSSAPKPPAPVESPPKVAAAPTGQEEASAMPSVTEVPPSSGAPLSSPTLAEMYRAQGHADKALDMYEKMARNDPKDPRVERGIKELRAQTAPGSATASSRAAFLAGLLSRIAERRRTA